ncbi:MAG: branched-chain amino acid transaminase [Anaerolineae bacterium]|jgi:branched-chain amino acid aminotransferase|nr:branched-chain amino acid transaminase [Anaerolineae bacterium]
MTAPQTLPRYAYFNGTIVPFEQATVSVMTHALNYGTAVFGGLRGYWNEAEEQLFLFRPDDHFERLIQSASLLRMTLPHTPASLTETLRTLLQQEGYRENCYVRPLAYKASVMIGVRLHDVDDAFTMFALPFGQYVDNEEGLHVGFSAWRRVDDNAIPARGKIAGAYANSSLIKSDALLAGYDEALVLTQDGHLSESSAANVLLVRRGQLITPPVSADLLEGITRRTVLQLAQEELGLTVVERQIDRSEIYLADELLLCGTGVQIAAVTRVEHRRIGSGDMGSITRRLRDLYFDVVTGRVPRYRHWLTPVYRRETVQA